MQAGARADVEHEVAGKERPAREVNGEARRVPSRVLGLEPELGEVAGEAAIEGKGPGQRVRRIRLVDPHLRAVGRAVLVRGAEEILVREGDDIDRGQLGPEGGRAIDHERRFAGVDPVGRVLNAECRR